jgi:NAD(P)-dependent dehydrogenase (short-subunit alcohol dehydrogenase family)
MAYDLKNKTFVVTGATSGIGLAAVKKFISEGAVVIGVGRSADRIVEAETAVLAEHAPGKFDFLLADLASQTQVRELSEKIKTRFNLMGYSHLDVLVNNAGVYLGKKQITEDGIEKTFAVNHLAPFLLTNQLLPLLMQAVTGRVLTLSSYAHFTTLLPLNRIVNPCPYISLLAYKRSKLCNVLFTYEFNRRVGGVTALAVDPGLVNTDIASKGSQGISHRIWKKRRMKGISPLESATTLLYLSCEEDINTSHGYYFMKSKAKLPSRNAQRTDLAEKLWVKSCQLTGIAW